MEVESSSYQTTLLLSQEHRYFLLGVTYDHLKQKKGQPQFYKAAADLFPSGFMFDGALEEKEHQRAIRTT